MSEAKKTTRKPKAPEKDTVTAQITTERGPFWDGKALALNAVVELPTDMFDTLEKRGWAKRYGG